MIKPNNKSECPEMPPKKETDDKSGITRLASEAKAHTEAAAVITNENIKLLNLENILFSPLVYLIAGYFIFS